MKGVVDEGLRALIKVQVGNQRFAPKTTLEVWIDTAFNGGLMLPRADIERLGLTAYSVTPAILADGQHVELQTYTCFLDWFGREYRTQVIANEGATPLLGSMLLNGRDLAISYKRRTVSLK